MYKETFRINSASHLKVQEKITCKRVNMYIKTKCHIAFKGDGPIRLKYT